jgi:hypothetical protein
VGLLYVIVFINVEISYLNVNLGDYFSLFFHNGVMVEVDNLDFNLRVFYKNIHNGTYRQFFIKKQN